MSTYSPSKRNLQDLPTEIFQHICWLSLNPSLYLVSKDISSLLPTYSAFEHDLSLTIFIATPVYGAWAKLPPPRRFLTPAARACPQIDVLSTCPVARLDAQRYLLVHPWLTLRKLYHHILPMLARTWVDTHWDGFSTATPQLRQDLANFLTKYYTETIKISDEWSQNIGLFTYESSDGKAIRRLYTYPRGLGIEEECEDVVAQSSATNSDQQQQQRPLPPPEERHHSSQRPRHLIDLRCIPDWVLQQTGSSDDWTSGMSTRWIEDAAQADRELDMTHLYPSTLTFTRPDTIPILEPLEYNPTLLATIAIRSLTLDNKYNSSSTHFGLWVAKHIFPLWSTCSDIKGARAAASTVLCAAARMEQWKFVVRNIEVQRRCLSEETELREVMMPLVKAAEAQAIRNGEGRNNMGGRVWSYGSLLFINYLKEKLERSAREHGYGYGHDVDDDDGVVGELGVGSDEGSGGGGVDGENNTAATTAVAAATQT